MFKPSGAKQTISIGLFYDGNYFYHVSNYYFRAHQRGSRISIKGLHDFITQAVSQKEGVDPCYCKIVDAHYFRGRITATEARERDSLYTERTFDQVLMRERVVTHYLPMTPVGEKGIDVLLALEAFEQAVYKRFDVVVLMASDGDFIPLVRKLNSLGCRVMVLGWDFRHEDPSSQIHETITSGTLMSEANYPMKMHELIDDPANGEDPWINGLFVERREYEEMLDIQPGKGADGAGIVKYINKSLKDGFGYGFISRGEENDDLYFYSSDVMDVDFYDLRVGDAVEYTYGTNDRGVCARQVKLIKKGGAA
jgi:uncharacterized LabA/DUF88 family protein/cold shock CspA family protein